MYHQWADSTRYSHPVSLVVRTCGVSGVGSAHKVAVLSGQLFGLVHGHLSRACVSQLVRTLLSGIIW